MTSIRIQDSSAASSVSTAADKLHYSKSTPMKAMAHYAGGCPCRLIAFLPSSVDLGGALPIAAPKLVGRCQAASCSIINAHQVWAIAGTAHRYHVCQYDTNPRRQEVRKVSVFPSSPTVPGDFSRAHHTCGVGCRSSSSRGRPGHVPLMAPPGATCHCAPNNAGQASGHSCVASARRGPRPLPPGSQIDDSNMDIPRCCTHRQIQA